MRALLDVNIIIALLDPDHAFHKRAHDWWAANAESGWASCPITENGVVRIMSNPIYSAKMRFAPDDLIGRLREFAGRSNHEFWPDDISLRDEKIFAAERIHSSRQLTDLYLLALAAQHQGRLATFDQGIPLSAVTNARPANLCVA
jgi:toxin-antitoxin system PIN domain toxin